MGRLIAEILLLLSEFALNIQEFLFQRKKRKQRALEKEKGLPRKRMLSPHQRKNIVSYIFGALFLLIIGRFSFFSGKKTTKEKMTEIKELLEKEKAVFGSYPETLETIKRGNPLREDLLIDGWKHPFYYEIQENGNAYLLISSGSDGVFGTKDDL